MKFKLFFPWVLRSVCAKYLVSSWNSLWDMAKTSFQHEGGATWGQNWNYILIESEGVSVPNIRSLAQIVSEIWPKEFFIMKVAPPDEEIQTIFPWVIRSVCAKYQVSSSNSLWDIVKTKLWRLFWTWRWCHLMPKI